MAHDYSLLKQGLYAIRKTKEKFTFGGRIQFSYALPNDHITMPNMCCPVTKFINQNLKMPLVCMVDSISIKAIYKLHLFQLGFEKRVGDKMYTFHHHPYILWQSNGYVFLL